MEEVLKEALQEDDISLFSCNCNFAKQFSGIQNPKMHHYLHVDIRVWEGRGTLSLKILTHYIKEPLPVSQLQIWTHCDVVPVPD